jgi:hypothetical protein
VTASNKPYDGSTVATLTAGSVTGVVGGDIVTVVAGIGTFASAAEGTWAVTASGYALGGANAGNYVLAAQPAVPDATITSVTGIIFTTTALNTAATATGAEILNTGTLVEANHVGNGGQTAITLANGLAFGTSTSHLVTGWTPHNASDTGIATITNPAFSNLINSRWWVAYTDSKSDLVINNLVIGATYRLQLISVSPNSGTVSVEGSPDYTWTGDNTLLTVIWVAGDTTLNLRYARKQQSSPGGQGGEVSFNGYALHNISPPSTLKDITSFTFPTYGAATIIGTNITLSVPFGTAVTAMAPSYSVSPNATGAPTSGTSRNFTTAQTYIITAQDLSTKLYTVTVAPLVQPTNLAATPGNNSVGLTWTTTSGASGYNVKRATTDGGPYAIIATPGATSYSDGTAANGMTYYYVVSATSNAGESADSSQVSAIPAALPSTITLASSLGETGSYGTAVTFTATGTAAATGTVTFKDGATVLGTGTLNAGQATYTTSTLAAGGHALTATYAGDAIYAPSTSADFSYTVSAKTVTITGVTAGDKVYDGNPTAVLTGGAVSGVINGDTVTVVAGTGTFANANAGTWAVTATGYALGGTHAGNYVLSPQPAVANATTTGRPLQLAGTRVYDGTTTVAAASLVIGNNVGGDDITLIGSTDLAGKDVGSQAITTRYATPARVRSATGYSAASTSTSFTVTMGAAPAAGNTLVAVISSRGSAANQITGISSTGASWARAAQSTNASGSTLEIWSAPVGSGAGVVVTIATTTGRCAGVVIEYSGLMTTASPVDQWAVSNNIGTAAVTGTTTATTQANEVWIGGIGYRSSTPALGSILNSFTSVGSAKTTSTTPGNNVMVYALEAIVSATGTAGSGGTLTASATWSGAIATFKAAVTSTLALTGSAAGNYTLAGASDAVAITAKPLTVAAVSASKIYDGTTTAAGTPTLVPPLATGDTATFLSQSFADANAGAGNKVIIPTITINDGNGGANYAVTLENCTTGTISPAPATITLGNLTATYTGNPKAVSATTNPAGLKVDLTYNGAPTAPTQPGTYAVVAVINDINYTGSEVGTLIIAAESITSWRERHFTPAEITAGLAADGTDPEGDGFTNLDEYTLGTDPRSFSPQPLTIAPAAGNNFTLTFVAHAASGAGYAGRTRKYDVECNSDPADPDSWQGVAGFTGIVGDNQTVVATLPIDATKKFYRLNVGLE